MKIALITDFTGNKDSDIDDVALEKEDLIRKLLKRHDAVVESHDASASSSLYVSSEFLKIVQIALGLVFNDVTQVVGPLGRIWVSAPAPFVLQTLTTIK